MAAIKLGEMVEDALVKAGVIRENQPPTAKQTSKAIAVFNGLMSMWAADEIELGDFPVELVDEELDLEREHQEPVKILFAVALQADHGLPPDPYLVAQADPAMRFLERNTFVKPAADLKHVPLGRAKSSRFDINTG